MHRLVPTNVQLLANSGELRQSNEGAALVIDAEGSTALAARLQPYGTAGAEALADVLAAIFTPMIERVVAAGGSVVELAGDGILAVFPGPIDEAVVRAASAASGVMTDLSGLSHLDTPAGPVNLDVRSVVGAGSLELVLWTSDEADGQNAAYAVLGSALDEARMGEEVTPGGVISAGPKAARSLVDSAEISALADGFMELKSLRVEETAPEILPEMTAEGGLNFFPSSLLEAELRSEFRDVVAVFVEIEDADESSMDHLLLGVSEHKGYLNHVTKAAAGGTAIRSFALWGAPISREHDVGYSLRFLEGLRSQMGDRLRAGVTRSTVYTGFVGASVQEVYTAIGPGVNLAARMCAAADWGEIRVDSSITQHLNEPWGYEAIGEFDYKGFAEPVVTSIVTYVPPVRVADPLEGVMIGRSREIDELEDLLAPLWMGRSGGSIAIAGEPGIGKSRLISALEDRLSARTPAPVWLRAQADEIRNQPLATLRDALTSYFGSPGREESGRRLDEYLADLAAGTPERSAELARTRAALGDLLGLEPDVENAKQLDAKARFENIVIAVQNLVGAVERTAPVIVAIADGHWIDSGTAEVLTLLSEAMKGKRLAILVETREPGVGIEHDRLLTVGPLRDDDMARLIRSHLGELQETELVDALVGRSNGNPFFAQQLVAYLGSVADPSPDSTTALADFDAAVPLDMRRLLVARLDGLSPSVRSLVQTASVLGRDVDLDLLMSMSSDQVNEEGQVEAAIEAGIWDRVDESHVAFTNVLIRDAAYGMLLHSDTKRLHADAARIISALAEEDKATRFTELAYHYDLAGDHVEAANYYVLAGAHALDRLDHQQALSHLSRAVDLIPPSEAGLMFEALRLKQSVYEMQGDRTAQEQTITTMEGLAEDGPERTVGAALLRINLLISVGKYSEAKKVAQQAEPLALEGENTSQRGQIALVRAQLARYQGRQTESVEHANLARDLFSQADEAEQVAMVNDLAGGLAWETGAFETAIELHRAAAETFKMTGNSLREIGALNNLGTAFFSLGDYSRARSIHVEGAERSREIGYRMGEGDHLDNMGGTAWAVGDYESAMTYYEESLRIRMSMNDSWGIAISKGNLGATLRARGNASEGLDLYREALAIDREIGRRRGEAYDLHGIGLCHLDLERYNLAVEALGEAAEIRAELGEEHLANESHVACAVAMLRRGDGSDALRLVNQVLESEGDDFFESAVETTAARLRAIEVLQTGSPDLARELRDRVARGVVERSLKISDPGQRKSYLEQVESHAQTLPGDAD